MKDIEEFIGLIKKSVELDPWIMDKELEYLRFLVEESNEVVEALEKKDFTNLKEELCDVFSVWAICCVIAEKKKIFSMNSVIKEAIDKIKRRRPYVMTGEKVSMDEAVRIWYEVKDKEKNER